MVLRVGGSPGRPVGAGRLDSADSPAATEWIVRAQDGQAGEVLSEVGRVLAAGAEPPLRVRALYAQAIALQVLGRTEDAVTVARELIAACRDLGLTVTGLRARALLAELLRRDRQPERALDELAHAVALESGLLDVHDPEVQVALGALAVALRLSGVGEETLRVEARLDPVEPELPLHQRVSRASNLAFEHAVSALAAARTPPFEPDAQRLQSAVAEISRAERLAGDAGYHVVADEAAVLRALLECVVGDPGVALAGLESCRGVFERGPEAVAAQTLWGAAQVRSLLALGRVGEAAEQGRALLAGIDRGRHDGDRLALAFEVLRAEEAASGSPATGARAYLALAEERARLDTTLLSAMFRSRVALLRGADERRMLARAASLDSLTGLVNRRGAAAAIAAAAGRPDEVSVALLMVDLDGFSRVNETCGHLAGDVVLQRAAAAVRSAARPEDVVARWGGDEFVVIAQLGAEEAAAFAARLRELIREGAEPGAEDAVTASIGVALRAHATSDEEWLRRAELALYTARRRGGDAVALP